MRFIKSAVAVITLVTAGIVQADPYADAMAAFKKGDYTAVRALAQAGDARAQFKLGQVHDQVTRDFRQAAAWYRKAADQGIADAQYNLGCLYREGEGVEKNIQQALFWHLKAANQGHISAQYTLGLMFDKGDGVPKDYQQAAAWYRKAADQGDTSSQYNLGVMYRKGQGVPKDFQQAYFWWLLASVKGDADAVNSRNRVAAELTPHQRDTTQAQARDWKPSKH